MQGVILQAWGVGGALCLLAVQSNSPPQCVSFLSDAAENLCKRLVCDLFGFLQFNKVLGFFDSPFQ